MTNVRDIKKNLADLHIEINGETYPLVLDMNALSLLSDKFESINAAFEKAEAGNFNVVKHIIWASLSHVCAVIDQHTGEPLRYTVSPYEVGKAINSPDKLQRAMKLMGDLVTTYMVTEEQLNPEQVKKLKESGYTATERGVVKDEDTKRIEEADEALKN